MAYHRPFSVTMSTLAVTVVLLHVLSIHSISAQDNTSSTPLDTTDSGTEGIDVTGTANASDTTLATMVASTENITTTDEANASDTTLTTTVASTENITTTDEANASDTTLATTVASTENITTTDEANASDTTLATTVASTENITTTDEETSSSNITTSSINDTASDDFNTTAENSTGSNTSPVTTPPTTIPTTTTTTPLPTTTTTTPLPTTTAPANHGENCSTAHKCAANMICLANNTCGCNSTQYYDKNSPTDLCLERKPNGGACTNNAECKPGLTCFTNKTCGCLDSEYFDATNTTDFCPDRKPNGGACTNNAECKPGLTCFTNNKTCGCLDTEYFDATNTTDFCPDRKPNGGACNNNAECKPGLTCFTNNKTCGCLDSEYFDATNTTDFCPDRKPNGGPCNNNAECKPGLTCFTNNKTCGCLDTEYFDATNTTDFCPDRKPNGGACNNNAECKPGLTCFTNNKTCGCLDTEYFDATNTTDFCPDRKPNGGACNNNAECKPGLTCFTNNKTCGCLDTEYFDATNTTDFCPDRVAYNGSCNGSFINVCSETNTACISYHASSPSRCLCTSNFYRSNNNVCISESNLKITAVHQVRAATYIVFYWTDNSNNSKVVYTMSWNGMNPISVNKSDGNATYLTPGKLYSFNITTTLHADESYSDFTSVSTFQLWTFPDKPGQVKTISLVSNSTSALYEIAFGNATGAVSYRMNVSGDVEKSNTSTTPTVMFELTPATNYAYTITAFNEAKDESEPTAGSFTTNSTAPGPVGYLNTTEVLNSTAKIKWQTPSAENGHLRGYLVQVKEGTGVCLYNIKLKCNNCTQELDFPDTFCTTTQTAISSYNVSSKYYLLELPSLKSYSNYTVVVVAVNEIGKGLDKSVSFRTDVGVPYSVSNIQLNSIRNESTLKVSLDISWTPGALTGPTDYSVLVQNETGLGTDVYSADTTYTVTGYSNTTYFVKEVLAYWQYQVSVMATTIVGSSESTTTQIRTDQTNPGLVQGLTVTQDAVVAKAINLTFLCPEEQQRNGIIKGFIIRQLDNVTSANLTYNHTVVTCGSQNTFNGLTNITVGRGYSFTVKAVNDRYEGDFGPPTFLSVETKVPQLKKVVEQLKADKGFVQAPNSSSTQETSIDLVVCSGCLTDSSQGEVIHAGLVICVQGVSCPTTGRKRRALPASNYSNYMSWSAAAKNNFISQYRTTPDDWRNTFQVGNIYSPYAVGSNTSCDKNAEAVYCNGPLPEGKTILITVVVCTSAGCEVLENKDDEFVLKVRSKDTNVGAIVGGVIGGLAFIVIVCLIVVFLYRRRQPKKSQPSRRDPWETPLVDKEIKLKRPVKIRNFGDHVARFHRDSNLMFQDEFENIQTLCKTFTYTTEQAKIEQNRMKNRYVDIIPYDHSRVKLNMVPEDDETKDFINANYIPGYNSVREYIATQGPMYSTVPDFWRMAWEQKCKVIIMLSDLMEKGKRKVDLYWPENLNEPINYDHVVVEMTNFSQVSEYIVRTFKVTKGDEARKMTHLFVPGWPDFTADVGIDYVLNFVKLCRQETPVNPGPIIVHCSAGVGRTGTYIAVDNFTQFVEKRSLNEEIDIFDFVIQMRKNRARMVQVESQYIFIYDTINKVIQKKIKAEEERLYDNSSSNGVYANMEQDENVYQNTLKDKYVYNNEAFVAEGDYSNVEPLKKSEKPITEL